MAVPFGATLLYHIVLATLSVDEPGASGLTPYSIANRRRLHLGPARTLTGQTNLNSNLVVIFNQDVLLF
jgi:hypothetical protein